MADEIDHAIEATEPNNEPTIVITFDDHGNMKLNATPNVDIGKFVLAAWLLTRQANGIADGVEQRATPPIALPNRQLHILGRGKPD